MSVKSLEELVGKYQDENQPILIKRQIVYNEEEDIEYGNPRPDLTDDFSIYLAKKFTDELQLHAHGKSIQATEYQLDAFVHGMRHRRALLLSPTASGKSLIRSLKLAAAKAS